ncbi:hypothetical protein F5B20DRAFT_547833 [Whalleya microplaca]|nr:hypothetical protein F5B20DRAFT_547833 [Whalleya microplaca]
MGSSGKKGAYPGFGLPLTLNPQDTAWEDDGCFFPVGSHTNCQGSQSKMLPVREVAMMMVMDRLSDKRDWHNKVFDDTIVSKWREEALAIPDRKFNDLVRSCKSRWELHNDAPQFLKGVFSPEAFDYCIRELRSKARHFKDTGLIPTLDASATVVKSDTLVGDELHSALRSSFEKLQGDQRDSPDWHPGSNDMVQDLVHPSLFPLVYGQTNVLEDEVVGVVDAISKWSGKGDVIPKPTLPGQDGRIYYLGGRLVPPQYWTDVYQWLPANVSFQSDGAVKFTSYINNLHPNKYPDTYRAIEKLIETALPAWDQCLKTFSKDEMNGPGRTGSRFPEVTEDYNDDNPANWDPPNPEDVADVEVDFSKDTRFHWMQRENVQLQRKWYILRNPVPRNPVPFTEIDYKLKDGGLREKFGALGLQVIVKMASIELTPEKPEFSAGNWHVEGQMNEHICATALYYLDSKNVTDSSLSFRMQTSRDEDHRHNIVQDSYHWMEMVYGTQLGSGVGGTCLQPYGSVQTPQGRLLAFPNVFQHRVPSFRLADPTKPGHRRFIALWLVDPHIRITSTANVPPQQVDWWTEAVFQRAPGSHEFTAGNMPAEIVQLLREHGGRSSLEGMELQPKEARLPPEILDMVRADYGGLRLMSREEAKKHREDLMEVRSTFHENSIKTWEMVEYSFCEH